MVVVREPATQRMGVQQTGEVESGQGIPVAALQADVMTLDGERGGETVPARHGCFVCAGGPVVDMTLGTAQAPLKTGSIFAEVVEDAGEMALVFRSERSTVAGGQIGYPR